MIDTQKIISTLTGVKQISAFRLLSLRGQLRMEALGMKSSGGPIRPRIAAEFNLKPRATHQAFIQAVTDKLYALEGYERVAE